MSFLGAYLKDNVKARVLNADASTNVFQWLPEKLHSNSQLHFEGSIKLSSLSWFELLHREKDPSMFRKPIQAFVFILLYIFLASPAAAQKVFFTSESTGNSPNGPRKSLRRPDPGYDPVSV